MSSDARAARRTRDPSDVDVESSEQGPGESLGVVEAQSRLELASRPHSQESEPLESSSDRTSKLTSPELPSEPRANELAVRPQSSELKAMSPTEAAGLFPEADVLSTDAVVAKGGQSPMRMAVSMV